MRLALLLAASACVGARQGLGAGLQGHSSVSFRLEECGTVLVGLPGAAMQHSISVQSAEWEGLNACMDGLR